MASASWPRVLLVPPVSASSLRTIAVEDRASRKPVNSPTFQSRPSATVTASPAPVASTTWDPPPKTTQRHTRARRSRENSMPIVNSSRITPISAAASTASVEDTRPSWAGPMSTPASRKPTIGSTRTRTLR